MPAPSPLEHPSDAAAWDASDVAPRLSSFATSSALSSAFESEFAREAHAQFVLALDAHQDTIEYQASEHLRLSGIYWALMAMSLTGMLHRMDRAGIIAFALQCQDAETGAFGGAPGHDPHLLHTLSALQVLALLDALPVLIENNTAGKIRRYICGLQRAADGAFVGDQWGEVDTRFSYVALNAIALLDTLDGGAGAGAGVSIDVAKAREFVLRCRNFDGGFGVVPGAESHAGQIFCCLGALALMDAIPSTSTSSSSSSLKDAKAAASTSTSTDGLDPAVTSWWLCERQLPCGGLNGRPEKKEDVCYSWWVVTGLSVLGTLTWIDAPALAAFVLAAQDKEQGGISDRADCAADVYHTYFGVAGLSLLGCPGLEQVDPVYALPVATVRRLGLPEKRFERGPGGLYLE